MTRSPINRRVANDDDSDLNPSAAEKLSTQAQAGIQTTEHAKTLAVSTA
jgi:hypothetical protein